ncbi:Hypothetical predicted protein [Cloeon dipterum]|uniref:F-box domain-containing protein n=1 Tax=Cloeon dipterum TaxID=197152 RepID=A0A8S1E175_9INSE|nr:Hypothetical predicted protein [Cloeon dipterum]
MATNDEIRLKLTVSKMNIHRSTKLQTIAAQSIVRNIDSFLDPQYSETRNLMLLPIGLRNIALQQWLMRQFAELRKPLKRPLSLNDRIAILENKMKFFQSLVSCHTLEVDLTPIIKDNCCIMVSEPLLLEYLNLIGAKATNLKVLILSETYQGDPWGLNRMLCNAIDLKAMCKNLKSLTHLYTRLHFDPSFDESNDQPSSKEIHLHFPEVTHLEIPYCDTGDFFIPNLLPKFPRIEKLSIPYFASVDTMIRYLDAYGHDLNSLRINRISDQIKLSWILDRCPKLQNLYLQSSIDMLPVDYSRPDIHSFSTGLKEFDLCYLRHGIDYHEPSLLDILSVPTLESVTLHMKCENFHLEDIEKYLLKATHTTVSGSAAFRKMTIWTHVHDEEDFASLSNDLDFVPVESDLIFARIRQHGRYLPGYVSLETGVGRFIHGNEVIRAENFQYDLMLDTTDREWLGVETSVTTALPSLSMPVDPYDEDGFLYFGAVITEGAGQPRFHFGQVREDRILYFSTGNSSEIYLKAVVYLQQHAQHGIMEHSPLLSLAGRMA